MTSRAERSRSIVSMVSPLLLPSGATYAPRLRQDPGEIRRYGRMPRHKIHRCTTPSNQLFIHVPDVGSQLPLIVDLTPNDYILAVDLLRRIALCLEAERADLTRR